MVRELVRGDDGSLNRTYGDRSSEVRQRVATYMAACPAVLATPSTSGHAEVDGTATGVSFHSDGGWYWTASATEAFQQGLVDLDPEFVDQALRAGSAPSHLSPEKREEALAAIMSAGV